MKKHEAIMARAIERVNELESSAHDVDVMVIVSGHNSMERGCSIFATTNDPLIQAGLCSLGLNTVIGGNSGNAK